MVSQIDIYYDKLLSTFGGINYKGAKLLATMMAYYSPDKAMKNIVKEAAEIQNTTPTACERDVRTYINYLNKIKNIEELRIMLDYPFLYDKLVPTEFIPALIRAFNK